MEPGLLASGRLGVGRQTRERGRGGMAQNPFVGTWRLVSWENRAAGGRVSHPLGRDLSGYILYTADGHMSVAIAAAGRPRFATGDLLGGTEEERALAAKTYVSYAGTYEIGDGEIIHH